MPLIRGHHSFDDHFTQIPNDWLRDGRLSFKARGVLALIMSHRQGWSLSIASIANSAQEGKDAIRSAVKELEDHGYLRRTQLNEGGRFGEAVWVTQDRADLPLADNPTSDNPHTKKTINKEEHTKEIKAEELFDEFWNAYPRKLDKAKAFRAFKSALKRSKFEDILAGVIGYRNDPTRNPDFTKYPATWLNSDSWENELTPSPDSEAAERAKLRREKERLATQALLEQQRLQAQNSAPAPKCEHGKLVALCLPCTKKLNE
jgi:hypothetical protein